VKPHFYDIATLNRMAIEGFGPQVKKISAASFPLVSREYVLLHCGAAFAFTGGPKLVSKYPMTMEEAYSKTIGIPGVTTTAYSGLKILFGEPPKKCIMPSHCILSAVCSEKIEVGLIIHEPLAISGMDLFEIVDIGLEYKRRYCSPLPLGVLVAQKSLGTQCISGAEQQIHLSIQTARKKKSISPFVFQHAPHLSLHTISQHIESYVGDETEWLSAAGRGALDFFCSKVSFS
jgi:1,4-dihydroxy-6-naphthoate synthase